MADKQIGRRRFVLGLGSSLYVLLGKTYCSAGQTSKSMNIQIDADALSVSTGGSGDPALLLHGFGSSKFTWRHICRALGNTFTYYAIDLPGSGLSPAPIDFDYSLENIADVVTDFIVRKDLRRLSVFGASLGGGIALLSLLRHERELAKRIRSLCIIDGIAYPQDFPFFVDLLRIPFFGPMIVDLVSPEAQARAVLRNCYFDEGLITQEQVNQYAGPFKRKEVRHALIKTARSINTERLSLYLPQLATISVPSLLIWGREDRVVPLDIGQRLAKALSRAQLVIIDRCGHMPQEECPDAVIAAIRLFVDKTLKDRPH